MLLSVSPLKDQVEWPLVRLGDHVHKVGSGLTPLGGEMAYKKNGVPLIRSQNVHLNRFAYYGLVYISPEQDSSMKNSRVEAGDVLLNITGASIGRVCVVPSSLCPANVNQHVCIIRSDGTFDPSFLAFYISSPQFQHFIGSSQSGATRQALTKEMIEDFPVPLLPRDEQHRIVQLLKSVSYSTLLQEELERQYKSLSHSIFFELFGDPHSNPKGWSRRPLCELGNLDRGRSRHRPRNAAHLYGGPYPFIQTGDVANSGGYIRHFDQTYSEAGLAQSKLWPAGTLCITIAANIGKTAILTFPACFPDSIVGFSPHKGTCIEYIRCWLEIVQEELERTAPESAQKNINLERLNELTVPTPPMELQLRFAEIVRGLESLELQIIEGKRQSNLLFDSILSDRFSSRTTAF